jgi:telomere length regulation protein
VHLLLVCLRSITGINSISVRLRALIQSSDGHTKQPDLALNLDVLLDLLCLVLRGDGRILDIWRTATAGLGDAARLRPLSQETIAIFGSGRVISLAAQAQMLSKTKKTDYSVWVADALQYSRWIAENIVNWQMSDPSPEEAKLCSDLFAKALRLGHYGKNP